MLLYSQSEKKYILGRKVKEPVCLQKEKPEVAGTEKWKKSVPYKKGEQN